MSASRSTFGRVGLIAVVVIFVIAVAVSNMLFSGIRLDLTENKLYTLSDGTDKVLTNIPEPINIYFFFSDRATGQIPYLRTYAGRVKEMLQEFVGQADGGLNLSVVDPLPFSEDEDRATEFGLQGINLGNSPEPIFMGIAGTNSVGDEEIIAFLDPSKESFLEYDLAKLIYTLSNPEPAVVGLISGLEINVGFDPQTQQMRQPWIITQQIQQLHELRWLPTSVVTIDEDIDVLMVVHPKDLSDDTLYAIDQFILAGGRAVFFVDPYAETDVPSADPANPAAAMMASRSSDLNKIISAWGLTVNTDDVIGDDRFALTVTGFGARPTRHIGLISVDEFGIGTDDIVTSGLSSLNFGFAGHIAVADDAAVSISPLVQSSDLAGLVPTANLAFLRDPSTLLDGFTPTGTRYLIAARIQGTVPSAFPDGSPSATEDAADDGHLAESVSPINVVIVADTDVLTDRMWAQTQNFFGQPVTTAFAGNGDLVGNILDNLSGSGDLISIRGRATYTRPFTKVQDLRREAESTFRLTEQRLQQELQAAESKLSELQANREDTNAFIMTEEQEATLESFQTERLRIRKELRQVQRNLDQDIEDLGTWLKIINIGLVPVLITVLSIFVLAVRRQRRTGS